MMTDAEIIELIRACIYWRDKYLRLLRKVRKNETRIIYN